MVKTIQGTKAGCGDINTNAYKKWQDMFLNRPEDTHPHQQRFVLEKNNSIKVFLKVWLRYDYNQQ